MGPYCRWSKWPPLAATKAVKRLVKFATTLLICSCGSSFQMVCIATFNSSIVLCFGWVYDTYPAWCPSGFKSAEFWGHWVFSMNPGQFACVLRDARAPCELGCRLAEGWSAWMPMVVTSSISNGPFPSLCPHLSTKKTGSFQSHPHTTGENSVRSAQNKWFILTKISSNFKFNTMQIVFTL